MADIGAHDHSAVRATDRLRSHRGLLLGAWSTLPEPMVGELLAAAGFEYVCLDQQHGLHEPSTTPNMLRAVELRGAYGFVRVKRNDAGEITKALDAGATAVVVPLVESAVEAELAVRAFRYPPRGDRSFGPTRSRLVLEGVRPEELDTALCLVQVETERGLASVEEIAATPGIDGIYVGPADLALAVGVDPTGPAFHDEIAGHLARIKGACRANGIRVGMHCLSAESATRYIRAGWDVVTVVVDSNLVARAFATEVAAAKGERA